MNMCVCMHVQVYMYMYLKMIYKSTSESTTWHLERMLTLTLSKVDICTITNQPANTQTPTNYHQSHQPTTNLLQRLSFPQLLLQSDFPRGHSLNKFIVDFQVFFVDFIINTKGLGHFWKIGFKVFSILNIWLG